MALLARFFLHEQISVYRWAGIALIALGVGFVTRGPSQTIDARGTDEAHRPGDVA
jgi:drug/metabolite transporter (DMT)-like permease